MDHDNPKKRSAPRSSSANNENDSTSQTDPKTPQRARARFRIFRRKKSPTIGTEIAAIEQGIVNVDVEKLDVNLEELMEHISKLFKHIEEKKATSNPRNWSWPDIPILNDLKGMLSLKDKSSFAVGILKETMSGPVKEVLKGLGHAHLATTGLLVVAHALEMYENIASNKKKCLELLKEMYYVANLVKICKESPRGLQTAIEEATALLVEGAMMCCVQLKSSTLTKFCKGLKWKAEFIRITQKLDRMYMKMNVQIGFRVLTATEPGKSPFWKRDPKHAVGIQQSITEVLKLLECKSDEKAVTVILHGVEGIGKTTLAEAVFSRIEGGKYSKVRLFKDIDSTRDIIEFQKKILKDLMGPEDTLPDIRTHEDGQDALEDMLEKVAAFIYIDNVLKSSELQRLLPKDLAKAKKARFLVTARDISDLKYACPTTPKFYHMKGIKPLEAMSILKKEDINESHFDEIIEICDGSPLRLTLVAPFIGRANDKQKAYEGLMQLKGNWERFDEMRCRFADYEENESPKRCNTEDDSNSKRRKIFQDALGNGEGGGVNE